MVVTIDGPAGAGKSSVARGLARRLGFRFLDTGATYRAVALAGLERNVAWDDAAALTRLARALQIDIRGEQVLLDGRDVTREIRTSQVTARIHHVADNPQIRQLLVDLQRRLADGGHVVTEGRDQGTVVFPSAECKVFLTASPEERALRRMRDLKARGEALPFSQVLQQQNERDCRDSTREVGRLVAAPDAIELNTDGLTPEEVIDRLEVMVRARWPGET